MRLRGNRDPGSIRRAFYRRLPAGDDELLIGGGGHLRECRARAHHREDADSDRADHRCLPDRLRQSRGSRDGYLEARIAQPPGNCARDFRIHWPAMRLETFAMERLQSTWENRVAWNLAESGVHPLRVEELAETEDERQAVLAQDLGYTQTNGTVELRSAIADLYPGATTEHVQVTNGGSEANCLALWYLLDRGDEAVLMLPNYMQALGLARGLGALVKRWPLVLESTGTPRWRVDLDALAHLVTAKTRLILICNPNNPTGCRLSDADLDGICRIA